MKRLLIALTLTLAATAASAKNMYIPAAAVAPGSQGTFWRTDLRIYNPSTEHEIDVTLSFLPQNTDGRLIPGRVFHIGKRQTLVLNNVVATLAPELQHAVGAIRIDSDTDRSFEFAASSRTYTNSPDATRPGTFGQFVPAFGLPEALTRSAVLHAAVTPEFRTNAGVMNPSLETAVVKMKLVGTDGGVILESVTQEVPPRSMRQWPTAELFGGVFVPNATIVIESTVPVFSWGSIVDNMSGDAIFVRGVDDRNVAPTPLD